MDLKTFSGDDFDPKKWINRAWSTSGNQEKEAFVASTVARLQLYMKQLTNSLDETTTQIVTTVPKVLQDASTLQMEGEMLQQKLSTLERQVEGVEEQTGQSIKSLQKIDQLKTRLENAASTLREADKWAALAAALDEVLEAGVPTAPHKLAELADQVAAMTASLEVLSDSPDYDLKRVQLETLYNRLEAAVAPPLLQALTDMDAERTGVYVVVLRGMGRGAGASRLWARAAAARRAAAWARADPPDLRALARTVAADADRQVEWLTTVVRSETPLGDLVRLYTDLLLSLEPSPIKVVVANYKLCQSPEECLTQLTDVRADIDHFVAGVRALLDAPRQNKEVVGASTLREFGRAAYGPLRALLPRYTDAQSQLLRSRLHSALSDQEDLAEYSRAVVTAVERAEGWLSSAHSCGRKIAGAALYPHHAPALHAFVSSAVDVINQHTRRIEATFLAEASAGGGGGVLSGTFPAALLLGGAADALLDLLAKRHAAEQDEGPQDPHPLEDLVTLLLEAEGRLALANRPPPPACAALRKSRDTLKSLARTILRNPVDVQLEKIPSLSVWHNNDSLSTDLPDFALSPQEYITEIGQYLMTLPQHLEMHLSDKQAPLQFLSEVCTHTCEVYAQKILNIRNMDALGTKRCLTDIVYLSSVVEDLGGSMTPALRNLERSLRATTPSQTE
ncbi:conserved oligomeric Golgi complex subunit 7 [Aricia agestis]|uniref:conserved oligomeric Golgi complex subunit 7 n=1 Tax=Aricia agestis TaxID=91739 RepID=UPI001C2024D7|nr:conserved oligomeric Golgi complex subunit 7 [Aricia agestis]